MKLPRFYVSDIELTRDFWLHDPGLISRWNELGYHTGQQVVLFDGIRHERLYRIETISPTEAHLQLVTDFVRKTPEWELYVLWFSGVAAQNKRILQQGTRLGATHFWPIYAEGSSFDSGAARQIVIQSAESAGRSDIPALRDLTTLEHALADLPEHTEKVWTPMLPVMLPQSSTAMALFVGDRDAWAAIDGLSDGRKISSL